MDQKILTIQDISCVGQCSLTVALPILSACGLETAILPSAVLSTHTMFQDFTFRDLTEDMPEILNHWKKEKFTFDAIYTGYLGSSRQIGYVKNIFHSVASKDCSLIVDPAMADNGKLYPGFNEAFAAEMAGLCKEADYILPNLTESCFMTNTEYKETYDESYIDHVLDHLRKLTDATIILTGVSYSDDTTGVIVATKDTKEYYKHRKSPHSSHGTGDVYSSAFTGAFMKGHTPYEAAKIAADYTLACIEYTAKDPDHWYGVKFEPLLGDLLRAL